MFSECATSPGLTPPFSFQNTLAGNQDMEDYGVSEESLCAPPEDKSPELMRCCSLAPKSALRGGHEELGMGPRPKLHVKWAPSVWEPPCSSISHTVTHNRSRKKHSKHRQKVKASNVSLCKKRSHKAKRNSDSGHFRVHGSFCNAKPDSDLSSGLSNQESAYYESNTIEEENDVHSNSESGTCFDSAAVMSGFQCPHDLNCGGSLLGICGRIQNHFPYGEAI